MPKSKIAPPAKPEPPEEGLVGLFGHTLVPIEEVPGRKEIQFQFKIIRKLEGQRYLVQYFSYMTGGPTNLGVYAEDVLVGEDVKLYATEELWREADQKSAEYASKWRSSVAAREPERHEHHRVSSHQHDEPDEPI